MATKVFEVEELELLDGKVLTIAPLPIKPLREFNKEFMKLNELDGEEEDDESMDVLFNCALIAINRFNPGLDADYLEDNLDFQTMMKVIQVAGGVGFDPNQLKSQAG